MSINERYMLLWCAIEEVMKKNLETAQEYSRNAEELRLTEPTNSAGLRGQAIGLLYANTNVTQALKDRGLLNLN